MTADMKELLARQVIEEAQYKTPEKKRAYHREYCKTHSEELNRKRLKRVYEKGIRLPMAKNKDCPAFLGVHVAERALSKYFNHIERMPSGNPGYDFLCGRGFKIDVKSSCLRAANKKSSEHWDFCINRNLVADYFLCLAFDNRQSLEPQHVWLIPSIKVRHLKGLTIHIGKRSIKKWEYYERPLEKVMVCCHEMRERELCN